MAAVGRCATESRTDELIPSALGAILAPDECARRSHTRGPGGGRLLACLNRRGLPSVYRFVGKRPEEVHLEQTEEGLAAAFASALMAAVVAAPPAFAFHHGGPTVDRVRRRGGR